MRPVALALAEGHSLRRRRNPAWVSLIALALALALVPLALAHAPGGVHDRNVRWLAESAGIDLGDGGGLATVHDRGVAREMPIADALALAAARAGGVDLAEIAARGVGPLDRPYGVGDVWVYELGTGPCPVPTLSPVDVPTPLPNHPSLWWYDGPEGIAATEHSIVGVIIDWTTKMTGGAYSGVGSTVAGQSDFWCLEWEWGLDGHWWFPYVDGVAYTNDE